MTVKDKLEASLKALTCFNCSSFDGSNCCSTEVPYHENNGFTPADKEDCICKYFSFPEWLKVEDYQLKGIRKVIEDLDKK